jgi:mono/diheme cytochrome c family protein
MKRLALIVVPLGLALALAGCGGKTDSSSGTQAASSTPAASGGVAATSAYDAGPRAGESAVDEERAEAGAKLFQTKGCSACHTFGKKMSGPDLQGVSMRRTALWMENQILHPEVMTKTDPISHALFATMALQMPNQGLTQDEARSVIEFLKKKDHAAGITSAAK